MYLQGVHMQDTITQQTPILPEPINKSLHQQTAIRMLQSISLFWLLAKIISWKLWLTQRSFPLIPPFEWIQLHPFLHAALFLFSMALLVLLLFYPLHKTILISLLISETLSCLADQNRWQPWEYQYLFIVFIVIINKRKQEMLLPATGFILAAIYCYSGLGKINESYLAVIWDNMLLKRYFGLNAATIQNTIVHYSGYCTAIAELLLGAALFFKPLQKWAAWSLIVMHLLLLAFLGPFGLKYNIVVWPWNMLMIILLYLLFIQNSFLTIPIAGLWKGWNKTLLICWGVLPALYYAGWWDSYLSCRLYAGDAPQMAICIKDSNESKPYKSYLIKNDALHLCDTAALLNIQTWAIKEMKVPAYPAIRVYKKIEQHWKNKHPNSSSTIFYYRPAGKGAIESIN